MFANLLTGIEALEPVVWLRRSAWGYAAVNGAHIFGIALLVGSIINVDLRILGVWRSARWREGLTNLLPVARAGFVLALLTGLTLFSVRAGKYVENPAFLLKMGLLALALVNIVLFHRVFLSRRMIPRASESDPFRSPIPSPSPQEGRNSRWGSRSEADLSDAETTLAMRLSALASFLLWIAILGAGRAIGFV